MNEIFKNAHRKLKVLETCLFIQVVTNAQHPGGVYIFHNLRLYITIRDQKTSKGCR